MINFWWVTRPKRKLNSIPEVLATFAEISLNQEWQGQRDTHLALEEALEDYEKTLLPNATSFGQTVYVDGKYVGDVWCYCIDMDDEPNCMLSFCIFELEYWSKGIATSAVKMFIKNVCERYGVRTIGAFTYAHNNASIRVLEKNGFVVIEEFEEDGVLSKYLQYEC